MDVTEVLSDQGTITVRVMMSNPYFKKKIANGKTEDLSGFSVSSPIKISNEGFTRTDGASITGQMFEITIQRL